MMSEANDAMFSIFNQTLDRACVDGLNTGPRLGSNSGVQWMVSGVQQVLHAGNRRHIIDVLLVIAMRGGGARNVD